MFVRLANGPVKVNGVLRVDAINIEDNSYTVNGSLDKQTLAMVAFHAGRGFEQSLTLATWRRVMDADPTEQAIAFQAVVSRMLDGNEVIDYAAREWDRKLKGQIV